MTRVDIFVDEKSRLTDAQKRVNLSPDEN